MQFPAYLNHPMIVQQVTQALKEDIGSGDISASLVPNENMNATLITREAGILCGQAWFEAAFKVQDPAVQIQWHKNDADELEPNDVLATLSGPSHALLQAERTALNFLQTLSGTATRTRTYVKALEGEETCLLDTRKTLPFLRLAQKYAVLCGGGMNHRLGLYDQVLLKENHIRSSGSVTAILKKAIAAGSPDPIQIEVESLEELEEAIQAGAQWALLDNFSLTDMAAAVKVNKQRIKLEASGNVSVENIKEIARTGVNYISVGAITKHLTSLDLSLLFDMDAA